MTRYAAETKPVFVLVPAYNPPGCFEDFIDKVHGIVSGIVVVDDGSHEDYSEVFARIEQKSNVMVLHHAVNLGKGAALKTALNHACVYLPSTDGFILADADCGYDDRAVQQMAESMERNPTAFIVSYTQTEDASTTHRFIHRLFAHWFKLVTGTVSGGCSTGLRVVPSNLALRLLRLPSNGFDFDLDILSACKHLHVPIVEEKLAGQALASDHSYLTLLATSAKAAYTLVRFIGASLGGALVDNVLFAVLLNAQFTIAAAQIAARVVAVAFNYVTVKKFVFLSDRKHAEVMPKYLLLAVFAATLSVNAIAATHKLYPALNIIALKLLVESVIFVFNFIVQRDFIFVDREAIVGKPSRSRLKYPAGSLK